MRKGLKKLVKWNKDRIDKITQGVKFIRYRDVFLVKKHLFIDTTHATILLNKLFKFNPQIWIAFLILRLKMDLGFTKAELCNFTGLSPKQLERFMLVMRNLLYLKVFDILDKEDIQKDIERFQNLFLPGTGKLAWYDPKKARKIAKLGFSNKNYKKLISRWKFFHDNTYQHFLRWFGEWKKYVREQQGSSPNESNSESNSSREESSREIQQTAKTQTTTSGQGDEGGGQGVDRNLLPQQGSEKVS